MNEASASASSTARAQAATGALPPLCVDLDGTLLRTDSLHEALVSALRRAPWIALVLPFWLLRGLAAFKREVMRRARLDPALLPYEPVVLDLIRGERAKGRRVVLATAADETLARAVAAHLDLFEEIIASNPRFKIIRSQSGEFTRSKGKEVMEAFLKAETRKIHLLFAHNDDMAIGAIQAIEEAGMKPAQDIIIISIDAVKGAFEAMMAGKLNVSVECSPLLGPQLMAAVADIKAGKPLPKRILTKEGIFPMEVAKAEFPNRKY